MALTITRSMLAPLFVVSAMAAGCGGAEREQEVPPAQTQTQTAQPMNTPTTVVGCLRAGEASDTFVLTTSQEQDNTTPATYDLVGDAGVNLQDHVGTRVSVTGVISAQQQIATRDAERKADQQATGTAGTPGVQTATSLAVRRLEVQSVQRADGKCE